LPIIGIAPTVAAQATTVTLMHNGLPVNLTIYDTAGQDDYRCLVPLYARGAQVAVIVYAEDSVQSFEHIPDWIQYLESNVAIPHKLLVGNKSDLQEEIEFERSDQFAESQKLTLIRTSALTGQNIELLFRTIADLVDGDEPSEIADTKKIDVGGATAGGGKEGCCSV
jgi:small GTP-binding protein